MDRSSVITLIKKTYFEDELGQYIPMESKRDVFASVQSITQSEFFEAGRNGFDPQTKISLFKYDYDGEEIVEIEGRRLAVYRTYEVRNDLIELYLQKKVGI